MFHALKDLVGQFDCIQRSLIFIYVGLEQGPNSFIYRPSSPRASRDQFDLFIEKGDFLIFLLLLLHDSIIAAMPLIGQKRQLDGSGRITGKEREIAIYCQIGHP
jgi:hypothetical protein